LHAASRKLLVLNLADHEAWSCTLRPASCWF
jgi:hypothetical protein